MEMIRIVFATSTSCQNQNGKYREKQMKEVFLQVSYGSECVCDCHINKKIIEGNQCVEYIFSASEQRSITTPLHKLRYIENSLQTKENPARNFH